MRTIDNSLLYYISQIKNIPTLSREEEYKLAIKAENGDKKAQEKLISSNLKFVIQVSKQYYNKQIPLIDLISEGNLGLLRALKTFQVNKGYRFISYAVHWIKQSIIKSVAEKSNLIKLPLNANNQLVKIKKEINSNLENYNHYEIIENIEKKFNLNKLTILKLIQISSKHQSLDQTTNSNETLKNSQNMKEIIKDDKDNNQPEAQILKKDLKKSIKKILSSLKPIEKEVIEKRFGIKTDPQTLLEIGKETGLTKERIRQIEQKSLEKLRNIAPLLKDHIYN